MSAEAKIFQCQQCGYCCHGETTVSLDPADVERLVHYLDMPLAVVKEKYLRQTGQVIQMKTVYGHCIFFKDGCTVHPGKPWRCSQWPLHPSILTDHANFLAIRDSCPGLNQETDYEIFCRYLGEILSLKNEGKG